MALLGPLVGLVLVEPLHELVPGTIHPHIVAAPATPFAPFASTLHRQQRFIEAPPATGET